MLEGNKKSKKNETSKHFARNLRCSCYLILNELMSNLIFLTGIV